MHRHVIVPLVVLVAGALTAGGSVRAQTPSLPTAAELVKRHVAAIGGESAFRSIKSLHEVGTVEIPGQNISGTFEVFQARPDKMFQRLNVASYGEIQEGYDGKVGWRLDPQSGPAVLEGRELTEMTQDALFDSPLFPASEYRELTTVEETQFEKHVAYKVKALFTSGLEEAIYFDADSGLQIGWEGSRATPNGVLPTRARIDAYMKCGPTVRLPSSVTNRQLGVDQTVKLTSCEINDAPSKTFDLPKPIKALVK